MQSANESLSLVRSSIKYSGHTEIAQLKPTFLVNEDIGSCNKEVSRRICCRENANNGTRENIPLTSLCMIPASCKPFKAFANSLATTTMYFSERRSLVARICREGNQLDTLKEG